MEETTELSGQEQEQTAILESEIQQPEENTEVQKESKSFSQEELDAAIGKRLARERRKWEREQSLMKVEQSPSYQDIEISPDSFDSQEEYTQALILKKAELLVKQREEEKEKLYVLNTFREKEEEARDKYEDFDQIAHNENLPISSFMGESIMLSEIGPEILYHLGSNVKEAERIAKLPPLAQVKEIGKLEIKLSNSPNVPKTTNAPAPIKPINNSLNSVNQTFDTTDPRSIQNLSTEEWIKQERIRQMKKLESQLLK